MYTNLKVASIVLGYPLASLSIDKELQLLTYRTNWGESVITISSNHFIRNCNAWARNKGYAIYVNGNWRGLIFKNEVLIHTTDANLTHLDAVIKACNWIINQETTQMSIKTTRITYNGIELDLELTQEQQEVLRKATIHQFWEPKDGEKGCYVTSCGEIEITDMWHFKSDKKLLAQGRIFKTVTEAERFRDWEQAAYRLRKRIWELNDGEYPVWDWENTNQYKYMVMLNRTLDLNTGGAAISKSMPSWYYLKTSQAAEVLREELPEDLKIFLSY